ncbi:D-serine deaminase-like pyridoxal phosphate-dependent protein [Leucobacter exalbidus]|uniref:D-serine deaminase-like pyridoxal phosphate-dependent protein n=1 Tax=Leucobacter exalbidus TaxID=662960 RepID=A0A940PQW9_9MICO|nr:amino acid deaminase/aldolase [Leucobacter exalbidus]MBP1327475.1 D-serine deaminase-like pyridoxal phosphate-dependent protein [Leucobacter exalbidus]
MPIDLLSHWRPAVEPWHDPDQYWSAFDAATRAMPAPVVALSLAALARNALDLTRRAGGLPIRVASKSVRSRGVLAAVLALPGYQGVLAYTLAEALWLAADDDAAPQLGGITDVVVGYPTADRAALTRLALNPMLASRVTVMIDSPEQLDLIDAVASPQHREHIRVCIDLDASWRAPGLGHIGVRRSPVHDATQAEWLARHISGRPGFRLVGVMAYEAQIAGVADRPAGRPATGAMLRAIQRASSSELVERRAAAIALVRGEADLEFVNGGGTGSLERTSQEPSITEVAAGSGLYGPHLFDHYTGFDVAPAVAFGLDVVRKPTPDRVTVLGGGWIASGPAAADRSPQPVWPTGLHYEAREGAGEVQTPLRGDAARAMSVGDRVWLRHAKAGEVMEHTTELVPIDGEGRALAPLATYRGEGKCFL